MEDITFRFNNGDYVWVALNGPPTDWRTHAALGLIGRPNEGLTGLSAFSGSEVEFYRAALHWLNFEEDLACKLLKGINSAWAQNLLRILSRRQIQVLTQVPVSTFETFRQDPKFDALNLGEGSYAAPCRPYQDIHQLAIDPAFKPEFYFASPIEWFDIPYNIQELAVPTFGISADYDAHIQAVYPWLQVFDQVIAQNDLEWETISKLRPNRSTSSFLMYYPFQGKPGPVPRAAREIDLFVSGTLLDPYFHEKAPLLYETLGVSGINSRAVVGFDDDYFNILAQTKVTWTNFRRRSGLLTRAIDSLGMGCVVLAPESTLSLFVREDQGLVLYKSAQELPNKIRSILADWPKYEAQAREGAAIIRSEFSEPNVASLWLRFLTILAAKPRAPREIVPPKVLVQKELGFVVRPWNLADSKERWLQNCARVNPDSQSPDNLRAIIDATREGTMGYARFWHPTALRTKTTPVSRKEYSINSALFSLGLRLFPKSLPLRFNAIRFYLHCAEPSEVNIAIRLAHDTLKIPYDAWQIDPTLDVFPWDFFRSMFNYRSYLDLATEELMEPSGRSHKFARLIYASIHNYLGFYTNAVENYEQAVAFDPEFPVYQLRLAQSLIQSAARSTPDSIENYQKAGQLLETLAQGSIVFPESFEWLSQLQNQGLYSSPHFPKLEETMKTFKKSVELRSADEWMTVRLNPASDPTLAL